jgi:hypothetical protein
MRKIMVENLKIREKYHRGFEREKSDINQIVLHGTGGGASAGGLMAWMLDGERGNDYKKGVALFHYLIDYNGDIYNIIDPDRWVYHSSSGQHDRHTIGIELMNIDRDNRDVYTIAQYQSLSDIIFELMGKYPIDSIIGHGACKNIYTGTYKLCPGNLNWLLIAGTLTEKGYKYFSENREYLSNIRRKS